MVVIDQRLDRWFMFVANDPNRDFCVVTTPESVLQRWQRNLAQQRR
jgi:hypothetical protein